VVCSHLKLELCTPLCHLFKVQKASQ